MKGFLFIGDPHVASLRPGRRIDDYRASVIGKLHEAAEIATRLELFPVILGDLFHRPGENNLATLSRLTTALSSFAERPIVIGGNHDKHETLLGEEDALHLLAQVGIIEVIDGSSREVRRFEFHGKTVALWVAPYGAALPSSIEAPGADVVALVTHRDLAFEGAYPGAAPLREIPGCAVVVNGHMHDTAPSVKVGHTVWHNPGNIEPLSVDCIDHVPAVWAWEPSDPQVLTPYPVAHNRDCFDLTGLTVKSAGTAESVQAIVTAQSSDFADLLAATSRFETAFADAGDAFIEELNANLADMRAPDYVQQLLVALAKKGPVPPPPVAPPGPPATPIGV